MKLKYFLIIIISFCSFSGKSQIKMIDLGIQHFKYSYEKMDSGEYAGAHWLASFETYALKASPDLSKGEE